MSDPMRPSETSRPRHTRCRLARQGREMHQRRAREGAAGAAV